MAYRLVLVGVCALLAACGGARPAADPPPTGDVAAAPEAAASCVAIVRWRGRTYTGVGLSVGTDAGERLGDGIVPACNDTGGDDGEATSVALFAIPGVDPSIAVTTEAGSLMAYVADGAGELPAALRRLATAPRCRHEGARVLRAAWTGILTDHEAQFDGDVGPPPYRLEVYVLAGDPQYGRAALTMSVPAGVRNPLRPRDVRRILWEGGTLDLLTRCTGKRRFVVDAIAPR